MSDDTTAEAPVATVAFNPETGTMEAFAPGEVPVPAAASAPPVAIPGKPLRFLVLEGEPSTPDTCETTISLEGLKCNVDLLTEAEIAEFQAKEEEWKGLAATNPNESIAARRTYYDELVGKKLKGFNNARIQPGQRFRNVATTARFVIMLMQKSQSGFCQSDYETPENFSVGS